MSKGGSPGRKLAYYSEVRRGSLEIESGLRLLSGDSSQVRVSHVGQYDLLRDRSCFGDSLRGAEMSQVRLFWVSKPLAVEQQLL